MKDSTKKILKPSFKKFIPLVIVVLCIAVYYITKRNFLLPSKFDLLNEIIYGIGAFADYIWRFLALFFAGGPGSSISDSGYKIVLIVASLISLPLYFLIFYYVPALFFTKVWDKFFERFRGKKRVYETIIGTLILLFFVTITVIIPHICSYYVYLEKIDTPKEIDSNYLFKDDPIIQELTVRNDSFIAVNYELPKIVSCLYDVDTGDTIFFDTSYKYKNGESVSYVDEWDIGVIKGAPSNGREVVRVASDNKTEVILEKFMGLVSDPLSLTSHNYEKLLLISLKKDLAWEERQNLCQNLSQQDIENAKEINIVKPKKPITLISPNGREVWEIGKTYDIRWKSNEVDRVYIEYTYHASGIEKTALIASDIPASSGKYSWTIPSSLKPGNNSYRIIIRTSPLNYNFRDISDYFFSIISK